MCLAEFNATSYLATVGKGKVVTGVVEQVANGGMLRITLLPGFEPATVVGALGAWPVYAGTPLCCCRAAMGWGVG